MKAPEPGIYQSIPFSDYQQWDAMNVSTLVHGLNSMKHLKAALDGKMSKDSKDLSFGRALHAKLLEPELFDREYKVSNGCTAEFKSGANKGKRCWAPGVSIVDGEWKCGKHNGTAAPEQNTISSVENGRINRIREELNNSQGIRLLRGQGWFECSIVFEFMGVLCKARLDRYIPSKNVIVDLKKVQPANCDEYKFTKSIMNWNYHIKAAFYCEAISQTQKANPTFIWLIVEDNEPFDHAIYSFDRDFCKIGHHICKTLLGKYKHCLKTGVWEGCTSDIQPIYAPKWLELQYEDVI
ncbi:MAG: PD-(D/E)XK nuclease-like domain-containing protein [Planctomycetaceae bacterium]|nr:PD-(D/E)XK nuclease-like domain-containing protein [Planctomycetaceae bacterium]